ncbi:MAG: nitroreductase family protein [Bacteroidales bacterium]|nr:nitroreductase family protein [Bacteroidales bacterium]
MLSDIVKRNRSYRRFYQNKPIDRTELIELVGLARLCPTGRNLQPLKFFISNDELLNAKIYPSLAWAGYIKGWDGPEEGERPSAYIVVMEDQRLSASTQWDQGIMAQTIMLGAVEKGLGGCIIASVRKEELNKLLNLPEYLKVALVLALGYPKEEVVIEPMPSDGSVVYWRDSQGVHHVPKRSLDDLIVG